jgi:hypothetical protein
MSETCSAVCSLKCPICNLQHGLFTTNTACTTMIPAMASHQMRAHLSTRIGCPLIALAANRPRARGREGAKRTDDSIHNHGHDLTVCTRVQNTSTAKHSAVPRASSPKPLLPPSASRQHHRPHGLRQITATQPNHNATQLAQPHQPQNTPASILRRETLHLLSCSLPPLSSSPSSSSPPAHIRATRRRTPGRADIHCRRAALTHPAA